MLHFVWAAAAIVFIPVLLFIILSANSDVGDVVYAMLSGSIVGLVAGTFALAKAVRPDRAVFLVFAGIVGAAVGWAFSWVVLRVTTVSVFSITALAFDLIVGLVGAASVCFFFIGRYLAEDSGTPR